VIYFEMVAMNYFFVNECRHSPRSIWMDSCEPNSGNAVKRD